MKRRRSRRGLVVELTADGTLSASWGEMMPRPPVSAPSMPDIKRLRIQVCDRCGDKQWDVNQI